MTRGHGWSLPITMRGTFTPYSNGNGDEWERGRSHLLNLIFVIESKVNKLKTSPLSAKVLITGTLAVIIMLIKHCLGGYAYFLVKNTAFISSSSISFKTEFAIKI